MNTDQLAQGWTPQFVKSVIGPALNDEHPTDAFDACFRLADAHNAACEKVAQQTESRCAGEMAEALLNHPCAAHASEQIAFKRLSDALTGGNAGTWDEIFHAAESRASQRPTPSTASEPTPDEVYWKCRCCGQTYVNREACLHTTDLIPPSGKPDTAPMDAMSREGKDWDICQSCGAKTDKGDEYCRRISPPK